MFFPQKKLLICDRAEGDKHSGRGLMSQKYPEVSENTSKVSRSKDSESLIDMFRV